MSLGVYAQEVAWHIMSIEDMFALADRNSKSLRPYATGICEAREGVRIAGNARLPEIEAALSFSYLGDALLIDRNFSNGTNAPMPHLGNNFSVEASQVVYAGGSITNSIAIARLQEKMARLGLDAGRDKVRFLLIGYYHWSIQTANMLQGIRKEYRADQAVIEELRAKECEGIVLKNDITRYRNCCWPIWN